MINAFKTILLSAIVMTLFGCLEFGQDHGQLKDRLEDIEKIVVEQTKSRENSLEQQLAASNAEKKQIDVQLQSERAKNIQMQIDHANEKQKNSGGLVPEIVWQICLSLILITMTAVTIKALFAFFNGNNQPTIVCISSPEGVKVISHGKSRLNKNTEVIRLLEMKGGRDAK